METFSRSQQTDSATHSGIVSLPDPDAIRWLHLSDFHAGKDNYGQRQLFRSLLDNIRTKVEDGHGPDLVLISGDIANRGKASEYAIFNSQFLLPLYDVISAGCGRCVFVVPGNRDVDRSRARSVQRYDVLQSVPEFLDPTEEGLRERRLLFARFEAFTENDLTESGEHWLFGIDGFKVKTMEIRGHRLGILGLNTAWLSGSDNDRHNLSLGKGMLETGLAALAGCDIRLVLGHHPLEWLQDDELLTVRSLLGRHNALYLHGHMHRTFSQYEGGAARPFLALQAGSAFQAREDERWVNRFLWCTLDGIARKVHIEPLRWSKLHQDWHLDSDAFPEHYRFGDRWILDLPHTPVTGPYGLPADANVEYFATANLKDYKRGQSLYLGQDCFLQASVMPNRSTTALDNGHKEFLRFTIALRAEDMQISPSAMQQFAFHPSDEPPSVEFILRPTKEGRKQIAVDFYRELHFATSLLFDVRVEEHPSDA